ncbi:bacteriocin [Chryseobacterium paridis]|uniref:Bacteriocin n=1 Tax=Chryseobacterium paridis TaxID=2800328 RepID=A0ABS1FXB1_9FLAO|nr:bacteriocin [Chryseobacterium paridis]MBK1896968.1 bacteriocin [Chryseobacterium paridis]
MKELSRNELKSVSGGFSCMCGTTNLGEYNDIRKCSRDCGVFIPVPNNPTAN